MNIKKTIFTFLVLFLFTFFSCNSDEDETKNVQKDTTTVLATDTLTNIKVITDTLKVNEVVKKDEPKKKAKVFKYICPQGDVEGNSDKEGICPTCEMELIENPNYTK